MMEKDNGRRTALKNIVMGTVALGASGALQSFTSDEKTTHAPLKGNINHAVCQWCFNDMDVETLCMEASKMGIKGIDLVGPKDWPTLKKYGLTSTMCNGAE